MSLQALAQEPFVLPAPGTMIPQSNGFAPAVLRSIKIFPDNPLKFDFILDAGESTLKEDALQEESTKLIKYTASIQVCELRKAV